MHIPEGFSGFVTSTTAPVASGGSTSPDGPFTHWNNIAFSRRTPEAVFADFRRQPFNDRRQRFDEHHKAARLRTFGRRASELDTLMQSIRRLLDCSVISVLVAIGYSQRATLNGDTHSVFSSNRDQFWNVGQAHRDFPVKTSEEMRGLAILAGDRDHFTTACAKAKAMNRACREMNERTWPKNRHAEAHAVPHYHHRKR
jgi:hypothetical protein